MSAISAILVAAALGASKPDIPASLAPYDLPPKARQSFLEAAEKSDVLILGEIHGTQEVPQVAAALLAPLTRVGYGALALEIPANEQQALTDWATGKSERVPDFFSSPWGDGRGNIQALSLIRMALSQPYSWKLICFDEFPEAATPEAGRRAIDEQALLNMSIEESIAISVKRDAMMAETFSRARARLADVKVLGICGNFHARTSKQDSADGSRRLTADNPFDALWPSFAAVLRRSHADWRVKSVNVVPLSGEYFATVSLDDGHTASGTQTIAAKQEQTEAELHVVTDGPWDWELSLPRSTAATFLTPPLTPPAASKRSP